MAIRSICGVLLLLVLAVACVDAEAGIVEECWVEVGIEAHGRGDLKDQCRADARPEGRYWVVGAQGRGYMLQVYRAEDGQFSGSLTNFLHKSNPLARSRRECRDALGNQILVREQIGECDLDFEAVLSILAGDFELPKDSQPKAAEEASLIVEQCVDGVYSLKSSFPEDAATEIKRTRDFVVDLGQTCTRTDEK